MANVWASSILPCLQRIPVQRIYVNPFKNIYKYHDDIYTDKINMKH